MICRKYKLYFTIYDSNPLSASKIESTSSWENIHMHVNHHISLYFQVKSNIFSDFGVFHPNKVLNINLFPQTRLKFPVSVYADYLSTKVYLISPSKSTRPGWIST